MKHFAFRLLAPTLILALSTVASAQTIDNLTNWNGVSGFTTWGTGIYEHTWGQTFIAPAESYLRSWETFFRPSSGTLAYRFYVAPWDSANARLAGSPIFASGDLASLSVYQYTSLKVDTNILLAPGASYVAFTSTSELSGQESAGMAQAGFFAEATYIPGGFVSNASSSFANLAVDTWSTTRADQGWDTAFRAEFQPVPEPATLVTMGLGAMVVLRWRRRS